MSRSSASVEPWKVAVASSTGAVSATLPSSITSARSPAATRAGAGAWSALAVNPRRKPRSPEKSSPRASADAGSSSAAASPATRTSQACCATSLRRIPAKVDSGAGSGRNPRSTRRESRCSASRPSSASTSRPSCSANQAACSVGEAASQRPHTVAFSTSRGSPVMAAASWPPMISAPLPRCDSTWATVHSSAPLGPASCSSESPAAMAATSSWLVRRAAIERSRSSVMSASTHPSIGLFRNGRPPMWVDGWT